MCMLTSYDNMIKTTLVSLYYIYQNKRKALFTLEKYQAFATFFEFCLFFVFHPFILIRNAQYAHKRFSMSGI